MNARDDERDGGTPKRGPENRAGSPYPLLFKGSRPRARKTFVDRIAALFQSTTEEAGPPAPPPAPRKEPASPERDLGSFADYRPAPTPSPSVDASVPAEDSNRQAAERPHLPAEGADPSPTAIHRATLQMLPGRLQSLDWKVLAQEIRFLRPTNAEQEVTLGGERADPPDHITIDHSSLQPRHALMRYRQGEWWIESLVEQDPVRVNDRPVTIGHPQRLGTGDRLGLGDIEFRYMGT